MTLREAIDQSFDPKILPLVHKQLSPPEQLKYACVEEFMKASEGPRTDFLRKALCELDRTGLINLEEKYEI